MGRLPMGAGRSKVDVVCIIGHARPVNRPAPSAGVHVFGKSEVVLGIFIDENTIFIDENTIILTADPGTVDKN